MEFGLTFKEICNMIDKINQESVQEATKIMQDAASSAPKGMESQAATLAYSANVLPSIFAKIIEENNQKLLKDIEKLIESKLT